MISYLVLQLDGGET